MPHCCTGARVARGVDLTVEKVHSCPIVWLEAGPHLFLVCFVNVAWAEAIEPAQVEGGSKKADAR
eukprot:scaffold19849_cov45-Isochrysis_galbana.AAC.1